MPGRSPVARAGAVLTTVSLLTAPLFSQAGTFTDWQLNGDAALEAEDNTLRVSPTGIFRTGTAWAPSRLSLLEDFSIEFSFQIAGGNGADGFTITFQNSGDGSSAIGDGGGALGYQGIENSVAFIYDTFDNGFDTDREPGHNTSVATDGNLINGWGGQSIGNPIDVNGGSLRNAVLFSWVDYDASLGVFTMFLNDVGSKPGTPAASIASDWITRLGDSVFVGFTAATGSLDDNHDILSFSVVEGPAPVPVPAAAWLLASGVIGLAGFTRRRRV